MSKMNFKSTLWALAFACAAVSCSDELADGPNNNNESEEQGEGVYLTVNIASPSGTTTKAPGDDGWSAEDGDGFEQGTVTERAVNDINVYLIQAASGTGAINTANGGLSVVNADASTPIVGHGYSNMVMESAHDADIHHTANTVRVTVNEVPTATTVYHVLAVANFGHEVNFSTLGELRDAMEVTTADAGWSGNAFTTVPNYPVGLASKTSDFVMSTHQMWEASLREGSSVSIGPENMDETNPAHTTVFVERLAARIDVGLTEALVGKGDGNENGVAVDKPIKVEGFEDTENTEETETSSNDYVKLTHYQVVNRWNGNNYLLKRVTSDLIGSGSGVTAVYPGITISAEFPVKYLYDEVWNSVTNTFNYVIDPNTQSKNEENLTALADSYESHYDDELNSNITTDFILVNGITTAENAFTAVSYTKENCLDLNDQIMGLVTGIIFKGEYTPNLVSVFDEDGGASNTATVKTEPYATDNRSDFYVVNDYTDTDASRFLTKDLTTIGALAFSGIKDETYASPLLKVLFGTSDSWDNTLTLKNLQDAVNGMVIGGKLNEAYKKYLQNLITPEDGSTVDDISDITVADAKWSTFLESKGISITDPGKVSTDSDPDAYAESSKKLYDDWNISYYKGGVCYFPYWIRHEDNKVNSLPGPMEFCIVRNNVYQVGVKGVNALGYPLPFVTKPETPVEDESVFLQVQIYVKDWTLRKNSGIIL